MVLLPSRPNLGSRSNLINSVMDSADRLHSLQWIISSQFENVLLCESCSIAFKLLQEQSLHDPVPLPCNLALDSQAWVQCLLGPFHSFFWAVVTSDKCSSTFAMLPESSFFGELKLLHYLLFAYFRFKFCFLTRLVLISKPEGSVVFVHSLPYSWKVFFFIALPSCMILAARSPLLYTLSGSWRRRFYQSQVCSWGLNWVSRIFYFIMDFYISICGWGVHCTLLSHLSNFAKQQSLISFGTIF